jgi:hypothetical protein
MRFAYFLAGPLAAVAAIAVVACSSGSSSTGTAANSGSFADQYCAIIEPCCSATGLSTTGSACHGWVALAAGQGAYDPAAGSACISAMQQAQSSSDFCTTLGGNPPACNQVFKGGTSGTVQPGGACMQDSDCAPAPGGSATCFSQFNFGDGGSSETRTCVQTTVGKAGDSPCIGNVNGSVTEYSWSQGAPPGQGFVCDQSTGLYCDATSHACSAFKSAGAACTSDSECGPNGYCDFASGNCAARLAAGSPCSGASSAQCAASTYCNSSTQVCTASLGNGSACTTSEQCQSNQCVNGQCSGSSNVGLALLCGN